MTASVKHEMLDKLVRHALDVEMKKLLPKIDRLASAIGVESAVLRQYLKPFFQELLDKHF